MAKGFPDGFFCHRNRLGWDGMDWGKRGEGSGDFGGNEDRGDRAEVHLRRSGRHDTATVQNFPATRAGYM